MAGNDNDLTIGIQATGGDQAAEELKKPAEALEATADAAKKASEETAQERQKDTSDYEKWLADHKAKQEEFARAAEENAERVAAANAKMSEPPGMPAARPQGAGESHGFGGQLEAAPGGGEREWLGERKEVIEETTAAIQEQVEALEDLTDAEAGVIRSKEQLNDQAAKPDGFAALFSQQRLIQIGREMRQLGQAVRSFAVEFAKTEKGQEILSGLSEETKVLGSVAANVGGSMAQGFATGGPIGAGIAGLTALVSEFGREYLDANSRIEQSNRDLAAAEAAHTERMLERQKAAQNQIIQDIIREENDRLEDQNEILKENEELYRRRLALAESEFALKQAQDEASGRSQQELEIERIQRELQAKEAELARERAMRQEQTNLLERAANAADVDVRNISRVNGTQSPEAQGAREEARRRREQFDDAARADASFFQELEIERQIAANRAATGLTRAAAGASTREQRDTERTQQERERDAERAAREDERQTEQTRRERENVARTGGGLADRAARAVAGSSEKAARGLEDLGERLAADPSVQGLEDLAKALASVNATFGQRDERLARTNRNLMREVEKLKAKLKASGDGR